MTSLRYLYWIKLAIEVKIGLNANARPGLLGMQFCVKPVAHFSLIRLPDPNRPTIDETIILSNAQPPSMGKAARRESAHGQHYF